jgi:hypothetical protein
MEFLTMKQMISWVCRSLAGRQGISTWIASDTIEHNAPHSTMNEYWGK